MAKKLFVGGIPWATTSDDLQALFSQHGTVASATVISDKMTGRSRGFGFVEFENDAEADAATAALNNSDYSGRTLVVKEARPLEDRPKRSFGGGGGGGGRGGAAAAPSPELKPQPICATIVGQLYNDDKILSVAHQFQIHTDIHLKHPSL
jgi:cold-inducible RNA-binding protein